MAYSNIFQNIVVHENSFTELFRNFLRFKSFRDAFLKKYISEIIEVEEITINNFQTQVFTKSDGIPDLVFSSEKYEYVFEIKVKNCALTNNQPEGYLEYLRKINKPHKGLYLLAPETIYLKARF